MCVCVCVRVLGFVLGLGLFSLTDSFGFPFVFFVCPASQGLGCATECETSWALKSKVFQLVIAGHLRARNALLRHRPYLKKVMGVRGLPIVM